MWSAALNTGLAMILWTRKLPLHLNCLWPRVDKRRRLPELLCQTVIMKSLPRIRDLQPTCQSSALLFCSHCGVILKIARCRYQLLFLFITAFCWYFVPVVELSNTRTWSMHTFSFEDSELSEVFTGASALNGNNKGKVFPYSLPSIGPRADPGVHAVSPQVTLSHPPNIRLPLLFITCCITAVCWICWSGLMFGYNRPMSIARWTFVTQLPLILCHHFFLEEILCGLTTSYMCSTCTNNIKSPSKETRKILTLIWRNF